MFKVIQSIGHQPHNKNEQVSVKFFTGEKKTYTNSIMYYFVWGRKIYILAHFLFTVKNT